jgi:hypothetical protein
MEAPMNTLTPQEECPHPSFHSRTHPNVIIRPIGPIRPISPIRPIPSLE